jgi:Protein kinase domain
MGTSRLISGRYRLLDPIGRGAMGVVWRGRDELLHRDVAVKEVRLASGAPGDAGYERTLREARAAAQLSHPGVITVFDILEEAGHPWIVMELVHGRSLDQLIAEEGPLPPRQAAALGASLVSALAAAHAAGVLHRDVKPANVLVTGEGRAVLTDFGIAKMDADSGLTMTGMVVGTPGFTAPERIRGEAATPASDLWSLGATLYAAVEGRGPFERTGGVAAVCAGVVREEPPRAPSAGPLGPVIEALLRKDPAARPDAAAAAAMLAEAAGGEAGPGAATVAALAAGGPGPAQAATLPPNHARGPAAFLDPPEFGRLAMPGTGQASGPAPGATQEYVLPAFLDPAAAPPGYQQAGYQQAGYQQAGYQQAGPGRPRRGYWRVVAVGGSLAAIVIAAIIGVGAYAGSLNAGNPGSPAAAGSAPAGSDAARPGSAASTAPASAAQDDPAAGLPAPPPGFAWHTFTAASLGTTAGFAIAVPDGWQTQPQGKDVAFTPPADGARIDVILDPFIAATPAGQAEADQAAALAAGTFPGYRLDSITPAQFRGAPAAQWRFTWRPAGGLVRATTMSLLATLPTAAGSQAYTISVTAPDLDFPAFRLVYETALATFRPLPG